MHFLWRHRVSGTPYPLPFVLFLLLLSQSLVLRTATLFRLLPFLPHLFRILLTYQLLNPFLKLIFLTLPHRPPLDFSLFPGASASRLALLSTSFLWRRLPTNFDCIDCIVYRPPLTWGSSF